MCGKSGRQRAFTVGELLITMTIIVLLIAIVLPSLAAAKRTARRAVCLSNLRQLNYSFTAYANDNAGRTVPANMSTDSTSQGQFWATALVPYSSRVDTGGPQKLLLSALCPSALTLSNGVGTATTAWGPTNSAVPFSPVVVGPQYGSDGLNCSLYSNNPAPPMVSTLSGPVGIISVSMSISGNHSVIGDAMVVGNASLSGNSAVTGQLTIGGTASVKGSAQVGSIVHSPVTMPNVAAIYATLAATPGLQTLAAVPASFDFNTHPVIMISGSANFGSVSSIVGSGTVLVAGNVTSLPNTSLAFNIVTLGTVSTQNGDLRGSIYAVGDVNGNGHGQIHGCVVTMGAYSGNGTETIYAAAFPSFDTTYYRPGASKSINTAIANATVVPTFADCVWAEAWPATGDPLPTPADFALGNGRYLDSNLGRFYINRHSNAINVAFLDGHAETIKLPLLTSLKWTPQF